MTRISDPITINGIKVKNRLTFAPTVKFDYAGEDGKVTDKHIEHYTERAEGGLGLICVEATAVTGEGRFAKNHLGLWEDSQTEGHKYITDACHKQGVITLIQLNHTGITGNPIFGTPIGPSAVKTRDGRLSRAMTADEIHAMQDCFVRAAVRAKKAGYDGIQLHGCHGYLINQFVSPQTNLREDEYGADKALFAYEIIKTVRSECGDSFIISVRTTGAEPDDISAINVAKKYVEAGCDYLQVSHGIDSFGVKYRSESDPFSDLAALGVNLHKAFAGKVPVSCVGGLMTPESVKYIIENELTDTVDLARAVLADPGFANAVLTGASYTKCFECERCQYGPGTRHTCPAGLKRGKSTVG